VSFNRFLIWLSAIVVCISFALIIGVKFVAPRIIEKLAIEQFAELAQSIGLSSEIGAFVAGVSMATSPIARYIALSLRPLRDFFLILFFFSLGAQFDLSLLSQVMLPAIILSFVMLLVKPVVFRYLLLRFSERKRLAWDVGLRLGQISELLMQLR